MSIGFQGNKETGSVLNKYLMLNLHWLDKKSSGINERLLHWCTWSNSPPNVHSSSSWAATGQAHMLTREAAPGEGWPMAVKMNELKTCLGQETWTVSGYSLAIDVDEDNVDTLKDR